MSAKKPAKGTIAHFFAKASEVKKAPQQNTVSNEPSNTAKEVNEASISNKRTHDESIVKESSESLSNAPKSRRLMKRADEDAEDFTIDEDEQIIEKVADVKSETIVSNTATDLKAERSDEATPSDASEIRVVKEEKTEEKETLQKLPVVASVSPKKDEKSMVSEPGKMSKNAFDGLVSSLKDFDPATGVAWKKGEPVPYLALAKTFEEIEAISSRLKIVEIMRDFFRKVIALSPEDLLACVYLSTSQVAPSYAGIELGIADASLVTVIAEVTGRNVTMLKNMLKEVGDLGQIAQESRLTQRMMMQPKPLTVAGVFKALKDIATEQGSSSMQKKQDRIKKLFVSAKDCEIRYLVRSLGGKLRIGLAEPSVLVALAHAFTLTPNQENWDTSKSKSAPELEAALENAVSIVKQVYSEVPCYDRVIPALLEGGMKQLREACYFTPGIPVKPMLAKPTKGIREVLDRFSELPFTCEFKYDGERAQIHMLEDGTIRIYSRNSENLTPKYPDIIKLLPKVIKPGVTSFVLDTEAVAINRDSKKLMPFQILSTRARKDVKLEDIKVLVCLFAFDCIYLNGECLLQHPMRKRRELLHNSFSEIEHEFRYAQSMDSSDVEEIQTFLQDAITSSCEGLMVKTLDADSTYEPSKRSHKWLKVKKDYLEGLGDSLDLVPIGAYHGKGKRTGVFGAYLLASYDEDTEEYQTICKLGTGFSEAALEQHANFLKEHILASAPSYYQYPDAPGLTPDVWFEPCQVWEVLAADLSISPQHKSAIGLVDENKGIALRFPRFVRIRDDKNPDDATRSSQVAEMYRKQASVSHAVMDDEDDD